MNDLYGSNISLVEAFYLTDLNAESNLRLFSLRISLRSTISGDDAKVYVGNWPVRGSPETRYLTFGTSRFSRSLSQFLNAKRGQVLQRVSERIWVCSLGSE
jgi:hypothetical protein